MNRKIVTQMALIILLSMGAQYINCYAFSHNFAPNLIRSLVVSIFSLIAGAPPGLIAVGYVSWCYRLVANRIRQRQGAWSPTKIEFEWPVIDSGMRIGLTGGLVISMAVNYYRFTFH